MQNRENPWKTLDSRVIHKSKWLTLYEDNVIKPNGRPGTYTYTQSPPFVLIVAHDGEHFIMVRQYRYPLKRMMIEFPGGSIEEGEEPLTAAKRELQEETGFSAAKWTRLGIIHNPNPATIYLAEELKNSGSNKMDEDGISNQLKLTEKEIQGLIKADKFTDSKSLAALFMFKKN